MKNVLLAFIIWIIMVGMISISPALVNIPVYIKIMMIMAVWYPLAWFFGLALEAKNLATKFVAATYVLGGIYTFLVLIYIGILTIW